MLPSCMHDLVNLRHLDIRGASCLKEMPKRMSKLKHLNFLSYYIVGTQEENGIRELGTLDNLHGSFCISKLENVKNSGEALEAKMGNKKHINTLKLKWVPDGDIDDVQTERDILDKLQPHPNLEKLSIEGYRGETFPDWLGLSCYSNMTKLSLDRCMNCYELPSLGQLPSLQHLEFSDLDGLEKIGLEFYNKNNASFQQETPFKCLETLKIVNMSRWREWHFPDEFDGFPKLRILSIKSCPVLKGDLPAHLPALEELTIVECEELACSLPRAPNLHQIHVKGNRSSTYSTRGHKVVIEETQLAKSVMECLPHIQPALIQHLEISNVWSAISISEDYLPASLQSLEIFYCSKLTFSEQLQHKSLTKISVVGCHSLKLLPLWDFPNLKNLKVSVCQSMEYVEVPHALPSLRYMCISGCPSLASLPALGLAAPHLEELDIRNCPKIDCFVEECLPPSLEKVVVIGCEKLARWITSKGLQSEGLTHLWLGGCFDVNSFPREGCLPSSLESLELWNFPNLETLDSKGLHHLASLKRLAIGDCRKLENVTEEHLLASIANIYIGEECPLRRKLEEMEHPPIQFVCYKCDSDYSDDDYCYD
ncbi:putative disease resistance protein At3g14460 [Arachis hypogaea]|uniref:putative disease resistance protein At3g14460 n=1 Tax=Arachis hypogaea TaxID=3818 RepID=UPI000DED2ECE|nr:putative disease resistance protein At3g14460 [Arachis hypogaea]